MTVETSGQNWEESTNELDIEELVLRAQEGEETATEQLCRILYDEIFRFAYRKVGNTEIAADITQSAFELVVKSLHQYKTGTFRGWVYVITRNVIAGYYRKISRQPDDAANLDEILVPVQEQGYASVEDRGMIDWELGRVREHIGAKRYKDFQFDELRALLEADVTYAEISEILGIAPLTVGTRISRLRGFAKAAKLDAQNVEDL